jgi:hypothetical protein
MIDHRFRSQEPRRARFGRNFGHLPTNQTQFNDIPPSPSSTGVWIAALVGVALWTLLAWLSYASVDAVMNWLAANAGAVIEGGKDLAGAAGVGKEAGSFAERLNAGGFVAEVTKLLQVALRPAIVVVWALGVLGLLAAPLLVSRVRRMVGRRH